MKRALVVATLSTLALLPLYAVSKTRNAPKQNIETRSTKSLVKLRLLEPTTSSVVSLAWSHYEGEDWRSYEVHRGAISGFVPTRKTLIASTDFSNVTYVNRRLKPSTTYYYKAAVMTNSGKRLISNEVVTKTLPPLTPTRPKPIELEIHPKPEPFRIDLIFEPHFAEDFDHYEIHKGESPNFQVSKRTVVGSGADPNYGYFTDKSVKPGRTYYYKLVIFHQNGKSAASKVVAVKTPPIPVRPLLLSLRSTSAKEVRISWTAQSEMIFVRYEVHCSPIKNFTPSDQTMIAEIAHPTENYFVDTEAKTEATAGESIYYKVIYYGNYSDDLKPIVSNQVEVRLPKK